MSDEIQYKLHQGFIHLLGKNSATEESFPEIYTNMFVS